jgi:ComF family protein
MLQTVKDYLSDFVELVYPKVCLACTAKLMKGEELICTACDLDLPETGFYKNLQNPLFQRFWGRVDLQSAVALYYFTKGSSVQHLLHQLKYKGRGEAGILLGKNLGRELKKENSIVKDVDLILPVPLHWKKLRTRGYNQCDYIAQGISEATGIEWSDKILTREIENISQTKKSKFERWDNVSGIFKVADVKALTGKHVLLVDDVVTTGATAESCISTLLQVPDIKVSFAAIATAKI